MLKGSVVLSLCSCNNCDNVYCSTDNQYIYRNYLLFVILLKIVWDKVPQFNFIIYSIYVILVKSMICYLFIREHCL